MGMIERVGAAIHSALTNADFEASHMTTVQLEAAARAAIEAMREPTEEMKILGSLDPGSGGPDEGYETEVWQAMIDAALKE